MCRLKANFNITHKYESIQEENTIFIRLRDLIFRKKTSVFLNISPVYNWYTNNNNNAYRFVLTIDDDDYDVPINWIV